MTPQNQPTIKKTVITFSILVGLLSVLIASTSWTYLSSRTGTRDERIAQLQDSLKAKEHDNTVLDSIQGALQDSVKRLDQRLSASKSTRLPEDVAAISDYVGQASAIASNFKRLELHAKRNGSFMLDGADAVSITLMEQVQDLLITMATELESAQEKKGAKGDGGAAAPKETNKQQESKDPGESVSAASNADLIRANGYHAALKRIRERMDTGLDQITSQTHTQVKMNLNDVNAFRTNARKKEEVYLTKYFELMETITVNTKDVK